MIELKKEYPITFAALDNIHHRVTMKRFEKAAILIEGCLEKNEILSTEVGDLKYWINDFVDTAYSCAISSKYLHSGEYAKQPESMAYISIPTEARNINGFAKKLKKIPVADQNNMYKDCLVLTEELMNLYEVMEYLKEHTVKARDKKKQEQEAKKDEEDVWFKKLTSHEDSKKSLYC